MMKKSGQWCRRADRTPQPRSSRGSDPRNR
jgi:hypothetical protein